MSASLTQREIRFLRSAAARSAVAPTDELVPAAHFEGTDLHSNTFAFYGERHTLGADINWDRNPGTQHWGHDLNRFGFLVCLDANRPDEIKRMQDLILAWIAQCDQRRDKLSPYAWQNLLNIAIRIENWRRFLHRADAAGLLTLPQEDLQRVHLSIYRQHMILLGRIRKMGFESNWALIGLRSALHILYSYPDFPFRQRLERICWSYLRQAIDTQILPDGVQQELSPHYHWVALELLASIRRMTLEAGAEDSDGLLPVLSKMAHVLKALICPDNRIVSLGDSDADYGPRISEFVASLPAIPGETKAPPRRLETFAYAGIASYRDETTSSLLVFDAGPFGTGHQHEDKLSFWLTARGQPIVVDPGRYLYERAPDSFYAYLRSSQAHSTICIDGHGQNARARPEEWRANAPLPAFASTDDSSVEVFGTYALGFGPERLPVTHTRRISHIHGSDKWIIRDRVEGDGERLVESRFQLYPCRWRLEHDHIEGEHSGIRFRIAFDAGAWDSVRVDEGNKAPKSGWWSPALNKLAPAPMLILSRKAHLPFEAIVHISIWDAPA